MSDQSGSGAFITWLGQALVVGFGWYVVHQLSVIRDRDKSRRELVAKSADGLVDSLSKILSTAREYHLTERDIKSEIELKMSLQDLGLRINTLSDICNQAAQLAACRSALVSLRRSITATHFEDEHQGKLSEGDKQLEDIAAAVMQAKLQVLRLKHSQFKE